MLKDHQDAYGHSLYDYFTHKTGQEIVERDDGYISAHDGPKVYFTEYKDWHPIERKAMRYARGRVLDIGSGACRHSLYLQEKGLEVTGIDNSPMAVEVCKLRGLRNAKAVPISQISSKLGVFDTVLMLGNNFGLFGSFQGARRLLKKLGRITSQSGRIIAGSNDIYKTENPEHLDYHKQNRDKGRMAGQVRLRVRYRKYATPWFDYLMVSQDEMEDILDGTGWGVNRFIESGGSPYIAIIDKKKR
ncbi:MAG: class I SAM-dependent methyltransferase [Dehalococcoidales bacterium]|nr:MAG: class I SAM-dependent methyltransferase [Dehalococcoidales bacterium]